MKAHLLLIPLITLLFASCADSESGASVTGESAGAPGVVDVGATEAAELITSDPELIVLDVRTPEEFAEGHIAGAVNIDYNDADFEAKVKELDPSAVYVMHCRSGGRSGSAVPLFEELSFTEMYHLNTGYLGWIEAGLPVEQ